MPKTILLIEDAELGLGDLCGALRQAGYDPVTLGPQEDFLAQFDQLAPELVFISVLDNNAAKVCQEIRDKPDGAIVPVLFIGTGAEEIRSPAHALAQGGDFYFQHPVDMERVLAKVATYVGPGEATEAKKTADLFSDDDLPNQDDFIASSPAENISAPQEIHRAPAPSTNHETIDADDEFPAEDTLPGIPAFAWETPPIDSAQDTLTRAADALLADLSRDEERSASQKTVAQANPQTPTTPTVQNLNALSIEDPSDALLKEAQDLLAKSSRSNVAAPKAERLAWQADALINRRRETERIAAETAEALRGPSPEEVELEQLELERQQRAAQHEEQEKRKREEELRRKEKEAEEQKKREEELRRKEKEAEEQRRQEELRIKEEKEAEEQRRQEELRRKEKEAEEQKRQEELRIKEAEEQKKLEQQRIVAAQAPAPQAPQVREGTLSQHYDVAALFYDLWHQRVTGRIDFRWQEHHRVVFFETGQPVDANSNALYDRMEEFLYREGKITRAQYQQTRVKRVESPRRIGAFLVAEGFLKPQELFNAVRGHLEEIIYGLFEWDVGSFSYSEDTVLEDDRVVLDKDPRSIVVEGIRRKYLMERLMERVGAPSSLMARRAEAEIDINALGLTPEEHYIVRLLDGTRSIEDLVFSSGLGAPRVYVVLAALLAMRKVEVLVRGIEGVAQDGTSTGDQIDTARIKEKSQHVRKVDYFQILGVSRTATPYEIDRAYEHNLKEFSPQRFSEKVRRELTGELLEIEGVLQDARQVLLNEHLRESYARHLR
ncbi:MAG: DUF4388 domain-containing protein [Myxococcota bacterium]